MPSETEDIFRQIEQAMIADRFSLRRKFKKCIRQPESEAFAHAVNRLEKSVQLANQRKQWLPKLEFNSELPVNQQREKICDLIRNHQVIIVCGETGSGKSTQLPKICLEAGLGIHGKIGHTQPRRIAARSVAARVAEELKTPLGQQVGYKVRFQDQSSDKTLIKLMTDGILLAETQTDRFLDQYDAIIIDEAHERSLNIDFLLGFLKSLLPKRPNLKLIITSATIDAARFSQHFSTDDAPAPIIEVSGRSYPVDILYRSLEEDPEQDKDYFDGINDAVVELLSEESGDILVFLPTEKDIRTAAKKLRGLDYLKRSSIATEILPLYARLSVAEQNKIFKPNATRRIVLATNVAESSLTVPRIKYVIDSGLARISRYAPRSKIQRLPIEKISQASANQRAGRCGRLGPGVCVRLFSEEDFLARNEFTTPEIKRTNLASVILQAKAMHFGDVDRIQFLEPPRPESVRDGYKTLFEIGATDLDKKLTPLGNKIKNFPCDPRISRILLAGDHEGVLADVLVIAAALEVQDVRDRPVEKQKQADEAHERFVHAESDFLTLLNIWDFYHQQKKKLSNSQLRKSLQQNFLSFVRIREWLDVYRQLKDLCSQHKIKLGQRRNDFDKIHRALLAGLLSGVALKGDKYEYEGAGGIKSYLWPGSGLIDQSPRWIVGTEVVETTRRYIRNLARIQPNWIEPLAKHLVSKSHSDPYWHEKSEKVMANEKVSLFGLTIVPRRPVPFGKIDRDLSRQIFIEQGLIESKMSARHAFQKSNLQVLKVAREMVAKTRDRKMILDDAVLFQFYETRLPPDVVDGVSLNQWIKRNRENHNQQLEWSLEDLINSEVPAMDAFPDQLATQSMDIQLSYAFEPGSEKDGISTRVPSIGLTQLNATRLEWLVPGALAEKIESLIRSLPKSKRRWFAPIQDTARRIASELDFAKGDLFEVLAQKLTILAEEPVHAQDFDPNKLEQHLKIKIDVLDEEGKIIDSGRDLLALQQEHAGELAEVSVAMDAQQWSQTKLKEWSFESIPEFVQVSHGGMEMQGYPALVDGGNSVSQKVFPSVQLAEYETQFAIMRLAAIQNSKSLKKQLRWLPDFESQKVIATQFSKAAEFERGISDLIARRAFVDLPKNSPKDRSTFDELLNHSVQNISVATQDVAAFLPKFINAYQHTQSLIHDLDKQKFGETVAALKNQLRQLLTPDFWLKTPWNWLVRFPVYFKSIEKRLEKLPATGVRSDLENEKIFTDYFEKFEAAQNRHKAQGIFDPELIKFRFMIEELRVSIFSQQLGTAIPVSPKRLDKQFDKLA